MRRAASKLLDVGVANREEEPSRTEVLERVLRRLEDELDRLAKDKR
jgi:hypothetical protein